MGVRDSDFGIRTSGFGEEDREIQQKHNRAARQVVAGAHVGMQFAQHADVVRAVQNTRATARVREGGRRMVVRDGADAPDARGDAPEVVFRFEERIVAQRGLAAAGDEQTQLRVLRNVGGEDVAPVEGAQPVLDVQEVSLRVFEQPRQ